MLRFAGGDYHFAFGQGMTGVLEDKGARTGFGELVRSRRAASDEKVHGAYWIPVPRAGAVRADLGAQLAIEARPRRPDRVKNPPVWERINYQFLNLFLIFFFLGSVFIITANNFPYDTDVSADDLFKNPSRMAKFIIKPPEVQAPKPAEKGVKNDDGEARRAGRDGARSTRARKGRWARRTRPRPTPARRRAPSIPTPRTW